MAYSPYYNGGWKSGEVGGTPITPEALNHMEDGISAALTGSDVVNNLSRDATKVPSAECVYDALAINGVGITAASGVTSYLFANKIGAANSVVTINGYVMFATAPIASTQIGTIAQGARPITSVRSICGIAGAAYDPPAAIGYITIDEDGKISVKPPSNNTNKAVYFSLSYYAQN